MNKLEKERLETGKLLVEKYSAKGYKASFEDEGASLEDISRAKIITEKVNLELDIKIGGCEAIADIRQAKILGAKAIIAPMIETPYAVKKFISAVQTVYDEDEIKDLDIGINIETITGIENIEKILMEKDVSKMLKRVTIGRVDLIGSMKISKSEINSELIFDNVKKALLLAKSYNIKTAIGGGIDINAIPFIRKLGEILDCYETRYIIFQNDKNNTDKEIAMGILNAQKFEVNYLEDISNRYRIWSQNNLQRSEIIRKRIYEAEKYINEML